VSARSGLPPFLTFFRRGWLISLSAGFLLLGQPCPPLLSAGQPSPRNHLRLSNGSLLVFEEQAGWESAAVCLLLTSPGSEEERKDLLADAAEHVLSSWCDLGLPQMVGKGNSITDGLRWLRNGDGLALLLETAPADVNRAGQLLADILELDFLPSEVAPYLGQVAARLSSGGYDNDPGRLALNLALGRVVSPAGPTNGMGTASTPQEFLSFLQALRSPANVTVSVCVPRLSEATVSFFTQLFGSRPGPDVGTDDRSRSALENGPLQPFSGVHRFTGGGPMARISLAFALPCSSLKEYWAVRAMAATLGGPRFSSLWQGLRRQEGLTYRTEDRIQLTDGKVAVSIECRTPRPFARRAEELMVADAERMAQFGLSSEECQRALEYLKGMVLERWQRPAEAAIENANEARAAESDLDTPPRELIESLTKADISSAAFGLRGRWVVGVF